MKKYIFLTVFSIVIVALIISIPTIENKFATKCTTVSAINATASKKISCKGIVKKEKDFYVHIQIPENDISQIKVGQKVDIHCNAIGDEVLKGKIKDFSENAYVDDYASLSFTVIDAKVELEKAPKNLKIGYSVVAQIILDEVSNATILPFDVVGQDDDGRHYIYRTIDGWATKEYIDVIFEDEKGFVVSENKNYSNICENPDLFTEERVRVNNGND